MSGNRYQTALLTFAFVLSLALPHARGQALLNVVVRPDA